MTPLDGRVTARTRCIAVPCNVWIGAVRGFACFVWQQLTWDFSRAIRFPNMAEERPGGRRSRTSPSLLRGASTSGSIPKLPSTSKYSVLPAIGLHDAKMPPAPPPRQVGKHHPMQPRKNPAYPEKHLRQTPFPAIPGRDSRFAVGTPKERQENATEEFAVIQFDDDGDGDSDGGGSASLDRLTAEAKAEACASLAEGSTAAPLPEVSPAGSPRPSRKCPPDLDARHRSGRDRDGDGDSISLTSNAEMKESQAGALVKFATGSDDGGSGDPAAGIALDGPSTSTIQDIAAIAVNGMLSRLCQGREGTAIKTMIPRDITNSDTVKDDLGNSAHSVTAFPESFVTSSSNREEAGWATTDRTAVLIDARTASPAVVPNASVDATDETMNDAEVTVSASPHAMFNRSKKPPPLRNAKCSPNEAAPRMLADTTVVTAEMLEAREQAIRDMQARLLLTEPVPNSVYSDSNASP